MRGLTIFLIIFVALIILFFIGKSRVPDMLANNLSKKLGVSVSIDSMSFRWNEIEVDQIEIGNAKGYTLPKAFSAEEIEINAPAQNYFKDFIVIDEIEVDDIYLGIEFDSTSSATGNWTKIMKHYQEKADLDEPSKKKGLIKRLVLKNIRTEVLFRDKNEIKKLPPIHQIVLTNISTEGSFPADQLMSSILGQMLKQVFLQQNLNNMLKDLILDSPGKAVEKIIKPFEGIFNMNPIQDPEKEHLA